MTGEAIPWLRENKQNQGGNSLNMTNNFIRIKILQYPLYFQLLWSLKIETQTPLSNISLKHTETCILFSQSNG